jgi:hypothetical protein
MHVVFTFCINNNAQWAYTGAYRLVPKDTLVSAISELTYNLDGACGKGLWEPHLIFVKRETLKVTAGSKNLATGPSSLPPAPATDTKINKKRLELK